MSRMFLRTLRDDPADAEVPSHKLLVRAGYIRRVAPGIYSWLPLGLRVLAKVEAIVREEMEAMGAQEVRFPALLPREPYDVTNRWTEYGPNLFRLSDRKGNDMLLGPTHEEMFSLLVKDLYSSYKDLPLSLFQIQTKYRDEARPRAGILRGREFIMKDSYSFDIDDAGLEVAYQAHRDAYIRIFDRLGFEYVIVAADSGAMGGSASEEFLAVSETGEDTFVRSAGGYAANVEAVTTIPPAPIDHTGLPASRPVETPGTPTIDSLVSHLNDAFARDDRPWTAADTLKNVLVMLRHPDGTREPLVIGVPGDREVDAKRLETQVSPAEVEPFEDKDFAANPALVKGYIGPVLMAPGSGAVLGAESSSGIRYLTDPRVVDGTSWVTGANVQGSHVIGLVAGRDFTPDGTIEAAEVRAGDPAPDGSGPLSLARGIEMGHIFQLGRKYAEALGLQVLDHNGKLVTVTMGSYGVGISRAVAAVAEYAHDDLGLAWPAALAPFDVHVVVAGKDQTILDAGSQLYDDLRGAGLDVLIDDRPGKVSPGVKFKDAELIGVPITVVVGRGIVDGSVELKLRASGEREDVDVADIVQSVVDTVRGSGAS
ncbi:proline--tRNA ligase [Aeromicrobium sp. CF3.5]|uniref:proline--tRNA ligase n=1 Tax=Aeromicrobium sp. CF3.5 TaxID=3373078 RepID=UPI003EE7E5B2